MLAPALRSSPDARRGADGALDAGRSGAAAGRSRSGGRRARPSAGHLPRHRAAAPALRRCGGCTAAWRRRAAISRAPSRCTAARSKQAEAAHDSRAIGLAHYELGQCYRQVGDIAIVREHITKAASALHAAGDRRHLALVHSLSSISLAQLGRYDEAMAALRQAERLAAAGPGRRRARHGLRQPGERDDAAAPLRAGAGAGRAQRRRCTRRTAPATASPSRSPRSARSACASAIWRAPRTRCTARSRSAARFSFTRRPARSSTRSRRFI